MRWYETPPGLVWTLLAGKSAALILRHINPVSHGGGQDSCLMRRRCS